MRRRSDVDGVAACVDAHRPQEQPAASPWWDRTPAGAPAVTASSEGAGARLDPRWSLANERTLLAYTRTALAFVVAGLGIAGSRSAVDTPTWFAAVGLPFIATGAVLAWVAQSRFRIVQHAMQEGFYLPPPRTAKLVAPVLALIGIAAFIVALLQL